MTFLTIIILELLFGAGTTVVCPSSPTLSLQASPQFGLQSSPLGLKDGTSTLAHHGTASQRATLTSEHTPTQQALRQENRSLPIVDGRSSSNGVALIQRHPSRLTALGNRLLSTLVSRQTFTLASIQVLLCRWQA